ncbi:response regulator [Agrobacterium rosae]|uniref:Response regulator n=1 Tax=Agrobacterium rosae TaxID=1972867 RepID=A0AAE5VNY2_9HYPH|nr:response regulator [Agrobacterium rosae]KAA3509942.1 response regulator [Agrobacterium rosae]KAA3515112.1 response regulator [Agrobacterium rosae]MCM2433156.1 response regulator [Agrobacterium rosae]MDX8331487.1 response regulator [Agrobacterium rosae]MQB50541.1 response regulator [Agrobacterium rosae]
MGQRNAYAKQVVLVVEDDPLLRMMAVDLVEDAGFDAVEACGADEAMEILDSRPDIDVLFTDIDMPGSMNGVGLANWAYRAHTPLGIVLTSGHQNPSEDVLPERSVFFRKPYDFTKVVDTLRMMTV